MVSLALALWVVLPGAQGQALALDCDASLHVPPTEFERGVPLHFENEVAIEPAATPMAEVEARARRQLVDKLCRAEDRGACAALLAGSKILLRGRGRSSVCAMAGILARDVDSWRASQVPHLRDHLLAAFG